MEEELAVETTLTPFWGINIKILQLINRKGGLCAKFLRLGMHSGAQIVVFVSWSVAEDGYGMNGMASNTFSLSTPFIFGKYMHRCNSDEQ